MWHLSTDHASLPRTAKGSLPVVGGPASGHTPSGAVNVNREVRHLAGHSRPTSPQDSWPDGVVRGVSWPKMYVRSMTALFALANCSGDSEWGGRLVAGVQGSTISCEGTARCVTVGQRQADGTLVGTSRGWLFCPTVMARPLACDSRGANHLVPGSTQSFRCRAATPEGRGCVAECPDAVGPG